MLLSFFRWSSTAVLAMGSIGSSVFLSGVELDLLGSGAGSRVDCGVASSSALQERPVPGGSDVLAAKKVLLWWFPNSEVEPNKFLTFPPHSSYYEDAMRTTYPDSQKRHLENLA